MSNSSNTVNSEATNLLLRSRLRSLSYAFDAGGADASLLSTYPTVILCDPGGAGINLLLPAVADSEGLIFYVWNTADAAETIIVRNPANTATIVTLAQSEGCMLFCDGTIWRGMVGKLT